MTTTTAPNVTVTEYIGRTVIRTTRGSVRITVATLARRGRVLAGRRMLVESTKTYDVNAVTILDNGVFYFHAYRVNRAGHMYGAFTTLHQSEVRNVVSTTFAPLGWSA